MNLMTVKDTRAPQLETGKRATGLVPEEKKDTWVEAISHWMWRTGGDFPLDVEDWRRYPTGSG